MNDMAKTMARRCAAMLGLVAMVLGASPAFAAAEVRIGAVPDWVVRVAPPARAASMPADAGGGVQYLLDDRQVRLEPHDRVAFHHLAMRATTGDGVEQVAHVEVEFNPAFEVLTLHAILVHRDGRSVSRLAPSAIHVLQREKDLEARIYDGRKSANVLLEDVRIGDVVEYDYSIRGINPAYQGATSGSFELQWRVPLAMLHDRLLVPEGRDVHLTMRNTDRQPEVRHLGQWVEHVWRANDVPALEVDGDAPAWYDPYPIAQWTDFPDWHAVAEWAVPLYRVAPEQGADWRSQVDAIARAHAAPADRLLATLRFVQREVRYLGIEVGAGSLAPRQPGTVLRSRYGDCKDKALLTVSMLQALGIDARVALVNTRIRRGIEQYVPSPVAFDHVVVRARVGGHDYWLDPTRTVQKGDLGRVAQADFGRALLIDPATTALAPMAATADVVRQQEVHTVIDASRGRGQPMTMDVTTVYRGESAEGIRQDLADASPDTLQRNYLNYYAGFYPGIATRAPFTVADDEAGNAVTVVEHYDLPDLWKRSDKDHRYAAGIYSPEMDSWLHVPNRTVRNAPLAMRYPARLTSVTEIRLHKDWPLAIEPGRIDDPAFSFSYETSHAGPVVKVTERLETRAEHVPAERVSAYVAQVQKARDELGLQLYLPDAPEDGLAQMNWPVAFLGLGLFAAALWCARRVYLLDPTPPVPSSPAPAGLVGWLLLPAMAVVVMPFTTGFGLVEIVKAFGADTWSAVTVPGRPNYHPGWAPVLLMELAAGIFQWVFAVLLAILFFRKRSVLPQVYVGYVCAVLAIEILDRVVISVMPQLTPGDHVHAERMIGRVVSTVLWVRYFMVSRRVAATFVVRLPPQVEAPRPDAGPAPDAEPSQA